MWPNDQGFLPTREGQDSGGAQERKMQSFLGVNSGIRTTEERNQDGSITTLRTRMGRPIFETVGGASSGVVEGACLVKGPVEETEAFFSLRQFHSADHLVSTDGIFTVQRTPQKMLVAQFGTKKKRVEFHFAADEVSADPFPIDPASALFVEQSFSSRTWYEMQFSTNENTEYGLTFCMHRLKSIVLKTCDKVFTWEFSDEASAAVQAQQSVALMNAPGVERGLPTRAVDDRLKELSMTMANKLGRMIFALDGGFLDALEQAGVGTPSADKLIAESGQNISSLSRAVAFGQPWHGWLYVDGLETLTSAAMVRPPSYYVPSDLDQDTYYFAIPDLPAAPVDLPEAFEKSGRTFLLDAIFYGRWKRYSPLHYVGLSLGNRRWLHWNPSTGAVHVLRLAEYPHVTSTTARGQIYDDGLLTISGIVGTPRLVGTFNITSPNTYRDTSALSRDYLARWVAIPQYAYGWDISGGELGDSEGTYYPRFLYSPVNASPTGDRVLISHYRVALPMEGYAFIESPPLTLSVTELTMFPDLSGFYENKVFDIPTDNIHTQKYAKWTAVLEVGEFVETSNQPYYHVHDGVSYPIIARHYNINARVTSSIPYEHYLQQECVMSGYLKNGDLYLTIIDTDYDESALVLGNQWEQYVHRDVGDVYLYWENVAVVLYYCDYEMGPAEQFDANLLGYPIGSTGSQGHSNYVFISIPSVGLEPIRSDGGVYSTTFWSSNVFSILFRREQPIYEQLFVCPTKTELLNQIFEPGYACYNPRTDEFRKSTTPIACV